MREKECEMILEQLEGLPEDVSRERIETVARDLERISYSPSFIIEVDGFLRMGKQELLETARGLCALPDERILKLGLHYSDDASRIRGDQLKILLYQYRLLCGLRADEPEAWDEIHELYEDD